MGSACCFQVLNNKFSQRCNLRQVLFNFVHYAFSENYIDIIIIAHTKCFYNNYTILVRSSKNSFPLHIYIYAKQKVVVLTELFFNRMRVFIYDVVTFVHSTNDSNHILQQITCMNFNQFKLQHFIKQHLHNILLSPEYTNI